MAVFDKKIHKNVCLDDTEVLSITIENAQNVSGHTEYIIKIQRGPRPEKSWVVSKRYSDFVALHSTVQESGINITLPPKKLIGNMNRSFINQRQAELQNYLHQILLNPILALSLPVRKFLDPLNYACALQESALQHVSMALRSEINFELIRPAVDIGWRFRKHYFFVKSKLKPKTEVLLQWVQFGPDECLEDKELQNILKSLVSLNHPNIEKLEYMYCGDGGCFTVRLFYTLGTLRDLIYGTKPKLSFFKKYGNPKNSKPLSVNQISLFGKQILETLLFLNEKGIPYGHLHLGNILVFDNNIKLLDIENSILGLPSYYRPFIIQHKKIDTMEAIDVYSFGHVLYEMALGYPLNNSVCDIIPPECPSSLGDILESILSTESCKTGLPTIQNLLQHSFFKLSNKTPLSKINFKLNTGLKQSLKLAKECIEKRLQEDQKAIRRQRKIQKMQELLISKDNINDVKTRLREEKNSSYKQLKVNTNNVNPNGRSPRSDSLTSNSTAASAGTMTPPLPASKAPSPSSSNKSSALDKRSALLDSICAFDKSALRRQTTVVNGS